MKLKLEEVGELSNEMNDHRNRVRQNPSKSNIHQEKCKKEKSNEDIHQSSDQAGDLDLASCSHPSTDDHLDQNIRKDDGTDKQQSSISSEQLQDDKEDGGTNVKKNLEPESSHDKEVHNAEHVCRHKILYHQCLLILLLINFVIMKVQHDISASIGPPAFDKHCPKVIVSCYLKVMQP